MVCTDKGKADKKMSIRVLLIDDERPSLRGLEILLSKFPEIEIIGSYTAPLEALGEIRRQKPAAVFIDINMPQMMGIDAASRILDINPETEIIFVTAYDQYAIEAFELHAIDYLLKPVREERLAKTIARLLKNQPAKPAGAFRRLQIRCLGSFRLKWEDEEPIKWRAEKTKELFAYLLHNRGRAITKDDILDTLWSGDDPDRAIRQLYNGIYYIRKAIEEYGIGRDLIAIDSNYSIRLNGVDYDIDRVKELMNKLRPGNIEDMEKINEIFTGEYLEKEDYAWAYTLREEYSVLHQDLLMKLALAYIEAMESDKAEKILFRAYEIDPYKEAVTEQLLSLYLKTEERNKGIKHFRTYVNLIKKELGVRPGNKLIELYQALRSG
jgi:two-component SAPR family response regulator